MTILEEAVSTGIIKELKGRLNTNLGKDLQRVGQATDKFGKKVEDKGVGKAVGDTVKSGVSNTMKNAGLKLIKTAENINVKKEK